MLFPCHPLFPSYTTVAIDDGRSNVSVHEWQIETPSGYHHNISTNSSTYFVHQFNEVGTYKVTLSAAGNKTGHLIWYYTHFEEILCRYVKRELRSLTHDDRDEFLQAMVTIWKTPAGEGRELYGDMFTSIDEFVLHHAFQVRRSRLLVESDWSTYTSSFPPTPQQTHTPTAYMLVLGRRVL